MPIAGFAFTKVSAERTDGKGTKIDIENNVSVKAIEEMELGVEKSGKKTLRFSFEFNSVFKKDFGSIVLAGDVLYLGEEKKAKEVLKLWKKDKKVDSELMPVIINTVLQKCNIEAILLSREVGLPSPVPLPKVNVQQPIR